MCWQALYWKESTYKNYRFLAMLAQPIWETSVWMQQYTCINRFNQMSSVQCTTCILIIYSNVYCNVYRLTYFILLFAKFVIGFWIRERKEREENERLGIVTQEDEEDDVEVMDGGPFRRVDVRELEKKVRNSTDQSKKATGKKERKKSTLKSQKSKRAVVLP